MSGYIIALDQGTTSSRAIIFDAQLTPVAVAQREFPQIYPRPGWVEHDPEEIWASSVAVISEALARAGLHAGDIAALGITNQRETGIVWNRRTGRAVHNAIVWQDRRSAADCARLVAEGAEPALTAKTGLLLDSYFTGTKYAWLLQNDPDIKAGAQAGDLAFGTVDAFLIWRLTGGQVFATDATNASRTLLYDITKGDYDDDCLSTFGVARDWLPEVRDSAGDFGHVRADLFGGAIPIRGVAGDQQAATVGQACFTPGMVKVTYGTGAFALVNIGTTPAPSKNRLLTTVAYQIGGVRHYALEGAIFVAGAAVQWLRDGLGIVTSAQETQALAERADPDQAVYLVPAFVGLGAPWWDSQARATLSGMTRGTGRAEIARAALESVSHQTADLLSAMEADVPDAIGDRTILRVDGGMVANDWLLQNLADILAMPVDRPRVAETTALGAAYLAGLAVDLCPEPERFAQSWSRDRRFEPAMEDARRAEKRAGWQDALKRTLTSTAP
ncbi:MAG: glycerol kinase GlpK [Salinarimonas sp.]|nr:glycerol kinase GlpK [Salinarimonas sp.]